MQVSKILSKEDGRKANRCLNKKEYCLRMMVIGKKLMNKNNKLI